MAPRHNRTWGLIGRCAGEYEVKSVTLDGVDVEVCVRGFAAKVSACLKYQNATETPLEVEYKMPIDEGAAVYRFEAVVDGRKITAQCMEKKKAENVYKDAVKSGHTAVLAREDELTSDVFHLSLGNLPAGAKAELQLSMIMELTVKTDGAVSFTLPAVLNPRYCPADVSSDQHTKSVAQHVTPQVIVVKPYTFSIKAYVRGGHSIVRIISHNDALNVSLSDDKMSAEVTQDGGFNSDHDWSMLLYYSNPYKTHVIRESGDRTSTGLMKDDLIMVNLHPEIPEQSYSNKNEIIFVVDRSGSMQGSKIQSARATLLLFLKSLPAGCYFNIISFGSSHSLLFPSGSQQYTEKTLNEACALHDKMAADMGGTEILEPLKLVYSRNPIPGYARQVLLLSDGEVFNVDQVKQLVSRHVHETRVFAVGIGDGASTALIKGLARAGRGMSEMVYQQDKLQLKVMGLVRSMLQECVQDVKVNFEMNPPGGIKLVPKVPPVIFGGQHMILYTRVPPTADVKSISIKGVLGNDEFSAGIQGSSIVTVHDEEKTLHRLAARSQILEWQVNDEEDVAEDMIALSLASGVVSRRTALVGVDQDMAPVARPASPPPPPLSPQCMGGAFKMRGGGAFKMPGQSLFPKAMMQRSSRKFSSAPPPPPTSAMMQLSGMRCMSAPPPPPTSEMHPLCSRGGRGEVNPGVLDLRIAPKKKTKKKDCAYMDSDSVDDDEPIYDDILIETDKGQDDSFMAAVNLQKFDGSWTLQDAAKFTSVPHQHLQDAGTTKNEAAWATALVLALLELKHSSEKDQWVLMAKKGCLFISGCGEDVEALMASARKVLA